ncbi:MAG: hypothetical protein CSA81_14745 [Acidobacteria bacterium]|nr:MAG: hypothetical protein CSA81_14745 [Acidobacteriota bacterium]
MRKKRILVYGDSNVWGDREPGVKRFATEKQWPNILQSLLGDDYEVVQEGLCARTAGDRDQGKLYLNGKSSYEAILRSASPVDLVVVALGTNDIRNAYETSAQQIAEDLQRYKTYTENYAADAINDMTDFRGVLYVKVPKLYDYEGLERSENDLKELNRLIGRFADNWVEVGEPKYCTDGLHYSEEGHEELAKIVYEKVKEIKL